MNEPSRNIPEPIKREVRQRCGFGCVICGFPLYDYEHMKEWSKVKEHVAYDITLLCPDHHRQVTTGMLPRKIVSEANENPFNLNHKYSSPMPLYYEGDNCKFIIGGNIFSRNYQGVPTQLIAIMIDGNPLLSFIMDDGHLLLSAKLFDEYNTTVLSIRDNQLFYSTSPWDIQLVGTTLTIREKARKILVKIRFEPPNIVVIEQARLLCNGVEIIVKDDYLSFDGNRHLRVGCVYHDNLGGIVIGPDPYGISAGNRVTHVNRYSRPSKEIETIRNEIFSEFL